MQNLDEDEQMTTYDMVKMVFKVNDMNNTEKITKNNFIKKRLKKLNGYGIIDITKDTSLNKYYFDLIAEKVNIRKIRIKKLNINSNAMFINVCDNWNVFVRDFLE